MPSPLLWRKPLTVNVPLSFLTDISYCQRLRQWNLPSLGMIPNVVSSLRLICCICSHCQNKPVIRYLTSNRSAAPPMSVLFLTFCKKSAFKIITTESLPTRVSEAIKTLLYWITTSSITWYRSSGEIVTSKIDYRRLKRIMKRCSRITVEPFNINTLTMVMWSIFTTMRSCMPMS